MSTTSTANLAMDNSSAANYRAWAAFISQAFYNFGWTQTSDTGQATNGSIGSLPNWSAVAVPAAIGTNYEIWKAADASASTTPIYVKVEYGSASTTVEIRVTVGTGSNGTGTITGIWQTAVIVTNGGNFNNNGGTLIPCFASGSSGEIRFMLWQGSATFGIAFGIERSKDNAGAVTTSYVSFLAASSNGTTSLVQTSTIGGSTATNTNWISAGCTTNTATENQNSGTAANTIQPLVGYQGNPMLGFMTACGADVGEGATVTVNLYGSAHTYIATKTGSFTVLGKLSTNGANGACLMRYE